MRGYPEALHWIIRERAGTGGWPPALVSQVSGWMVTRLVAHVFSVPVNQVALDIIEHYEHNRDEEQARRNG